MKKILYVILDGLGDEPHPDLGDKTPLEAAATPNLDSLARRGRNGIVVTVGEGIAPESDIAVFAILGYDPHTQHAGRGPLEALGAGLEMHDRIDLATTLRARTFVDFDEAATAPIHGFASADDYYTRSSSLQFLSRITTPTLVRVSVSGINQNQRSSPRTIRISVPSNPGSRSTFS